ncbi:diphosphomevalonate decarboxylase [Candidatus Shapirobacteria bacterium CG11_big_fil_rev_8_21_14_0_20_40_12]|uniref:diphosphomevalonate decarboxylase n=2 Tax=Candidatus Shapironibacteriota TaxID=1752721 RepID=A0A2M8GI31_9BACT|nr:MAG: diphosphomevalonate decarboxylase [Candidatus Shapirobacteria bacterium CG11_big_fil_rev_8_21_14_0_20_40_12]PJC77212.1 MAG: diphosphomevalonate decarboxylase [Candidatus Shapirobacteria bacterium CG_4_8_14_3_um_filter_39_11]
MKATAKAPANIASIKYWGRKDEKLRLPANDSISMNLSEVFTITTVEFSESYKKDEVKLVGKKLDRKEEKRIIDHLDRVRNLAKIKTFAKVVTKNNFPTGTGIASSASGFAALTVAAVKASGLEFSERQLSILARQGSGSACRSIPDGFVEWKSGSSSDSSYAHTLFPPDWLNIVDILAVVEKKTKKISSSEGHALTESSPFYGVRISGMKDKLKKIKQALTNKDFKTFGEISEAEAVNMHAVMMTSCPPLYYWTPETLKIILSVIEWREEGLPVYFTIDAGPNVHLLALPEEIDKIVQRLKRIEGIKGIIINKPTEGAKTISTHLF